MSLKLTMKSYHRLLPEQAAEATLEEGALVIGRNPACDWVILDPERVVSKEHCKIELSGNAYVLTDTSSNGVFLGDRRDPVGNGNAVILKDGDLIRMSDYEILVHLRGMPQASAGVTQDEPGNPLIGEIEVPPLVGESPPGGVDRDTQPEPPPEPPSSLLAPEAPPSGTPLTESSGLIPDDWDDAASGSSASDLEHIAPQDEVFQVPDQAAEIPSSWSDEAAAPEASPPERPNEPPSSAPEPDLQVTPADTDSSSDRLAAPLPPLAAEEPEPPADSDGLMSPPRVEAEDAEPPSPERETIPPLVETKTPARAEEGAGVAPLLGPEDAAPLLEPRDPVPPLAAVEPEPPLAAVEPEPPLAAEGILPPLEPEEKLPPLAPEELAPPLVEEAPPVRSEEPEKPVSLLAESSQPEAGPRAAGTIPSGDALDVFLAGAGLAPIEMSDQQRQELMRILGEVFREVVKGLVEVLAARTSIKSEFRLSQTTIRPSENNPLKFSLSVDDALLAIVSNRGQGYLEPVDAVREAFDDIKAHQVAFIAGMQKALMHMLQRFDPKALEKRMGEETGLGGLLGSKKAKHWDAFTLLYETITSEAEDDFEDLFGREFARAYEEQVETLRAAKADPQGG